MARYCFVFYQNMISNINHFEQQQKNKMKTKTKKFQPFFINVKDFIIFPFSLGD